MTIIYMLRFQAPAPAKKVNETKAPETANKVSTASSSTAGTGKNENTSASTAPAEAKKSDGKQEYSFEKKKKLDPKDFMFSKLTGQVIES